MTSEQSRKQTVLIVEDDAILRGILAHTLADEGYAVLTGETGEQALAIASTLEGQLGLVVTDILLPMMDGFDVAAGLADLKPLPPVLFISGVIADRNMPGPLLAKPFGPGGLPRSRLPACFPAFSISSSPSRVIGSRAKVPSMTPSSTRSMELTGLSSDSDTVYPCLKIQHTYDGTSRIGVHIGAFRFVCTNLAVGGGGVFSWPCTRARCRSQR